MRPFIMLLAALCCTISSVAQVIDPGFDKQIYEPGFIHQVAFDREGNTYFTGVYDIVNEKPRSGISKLNESGILIEDFSAGSGYNGTVTRMVSLSTDKLLIIGDFSEFNGVNTGPMVQINLDGTSEDGFAKTTGIVSSTQTPISNAIELPDGKLLVYGNFTNFNGFETNSLVLLNSDGTVDESFRYQNETPLSISTATLQSSGKIVVALNSSNSASNLILRLNADGSKDETFNDFDAGTRTVYKIMTQSSDKVIMLTDVPEAEQLNADLFRLNADGTSDETFDLGAGIVGFFDDFELDVDDSIIIGTVSQGREQGTIDGNLPGLICKLTPDGSFDRSLEEKKFLYESTKVVLNKHINRIFIYGYFDFLTSLNTKSIARFDFFQELDGGWRAVVQSVAETIQIEGIGSTAFVIPDYKNRLRDIHFANRYFTPVDPMRNPLGRPFDVEDFRVFKHFPGVSSHVVYAGGPRVPYGQNLVMWDQWEYRDPSFDGLGNSINDNWINDVELNREENSLNFFIVGSFSGIGGETDGVAGILKIRSNAQRDESFISPFNADSVKINDVEIQEDGKVIVAGAFSPAGETNLTSGIARLNADGSFDETFDRSLNFTGGIVQKVEVVSDGYIVGGDFTGVNSSETRRGLAKINLDGTLNTEFNGDNSLVGNKVYKIIVHDDAIYLGGDFTEYQGQSVTGLIKLDLDGNLDNTFMLPSNLTAMVRDFEVDTDDGLDIVMAGRFYDSESNRQLSAVRLGDGLDGSPINLKLDNVTIDEIDISWESTSTNQDRYYIERSIGDQENFQQWRFVDGSTTTLNETNLIVTGTTYYYRVQAGREAFRSDYSNILAVEVPQRPLRRPLDLEVTFFNQSFVRLGWFDWSTEEEGYVIERSDGNQENFVEVGRTEANVEEFADTTVDQEVRYFYRVKAVKGEFSSDYSKVVEIIIPIERPTSPSSLQGTLISENQIDLMWADRSVNEDNFIVYRSINQGTNEPAAILPENQTTYSDTDVRPGQTVSYYIVARNDAGESNPSNGVHIRMPSVPEAPSDLTGTFVSDTQIDLSWIDNSSNEERFTISRSIDEAGFEMLGFASRNQTSYSDTNVDFEQTIEYIIWASNEIGHSPQSEVLRMMVASTSENPTMSDQRFIFTYDPVTHVLSFKLNDPLVKINGYQVIAGNGTMKMRESDLAAQQLNLNLSGNAPGLYMLHVTSGHQKYVVKILKK